MSKILSYHNDPKVKDFHVALAKKHLAQDQLVANTYGQFEWQKFKGCSVGCMAQDIKHDWSFAPESELPHTIVAESAGWPMWLVYLNDDIFEGLPEGEREVFHVKLREAIPVGIDLEPLFWKLASIRLSKIWATFLKTSGIKPDEEIQAKITTCFNYFERELANRATIEERETVKKLYFASEGRRTGNTLTNDLDETLFKYFGRWSLTNLAGWASSGRLLIIGPTSSDLEVELAFIEHWRFERDTLFRLLAVMTKHQVLVNSLGDEPCT